jgi:hypothetical protein
LPIRLPGRGQGRGGARMGEASVCEQAAWNASRRCGVPHPCQFSAAPHSLARPCLLPTTALLRPQLASRSPSDTPPTSRWPLTSAGRQPSSPRLARPRPIPPCSAAAQVGRLGSRRLVSGALEFRGAWVQGRLGSGRLG